VPVQPQPLLPTNVRVLHDAAELAEAAARAADGERRLRARLDARALHDEWFAEHTDQRMRWLRLR
jgi:hypothetical protein